MKPRVVHEHVHAPEPLDRRLDESVDLGAPSHVDLHGRGLTSGALDVRHDHLEPIHTPSAEKDLGAFRGQVAGSGLAQPAAAPVMTTTFP